MIVLCIVARLARFYSKSVQKTMRRNRCQYCGVRLKTAANRIGYATTCKKCGRTQPWATPQPGTPESAQAPIDLSRPAEGSWKPEPLCRHEQRYWDGRHWTELVKYDGEVSSDEVGLRR